MEQDQAYSSTPGEPETTEELISLLRMLRAERRTKKAAQKQLARRRRALSAAERQRVLAKTGGRCHICGGSVDERWQADHVLAHSGGGGTDADNYLAAHGLCNNYRWDYLPEEFQTILKLGVWARTQIERGSPLGHQIASAFIAYEKVRRGRRKCPSR
jgi:hypothetical protein